jgi:hypothetical protein
MRAAIARRGKERTMTAKATKKGPKAKAQKATSRESRTMYAEIQQCVKQLDKSIAQIQRDLRMAEHKLEVDARMRIRELRKDARAQLSVLKSKQHEAASALKLIAPAASGTWEDIKSKVDSVLVDAQATATATVNRFRSALGV